MKKASYNNTIHILGYGNTMMGDDSLGPAFVSKIRYRCPENYTVRCTRQLTVDEALAVAGFDYTILVDASSEMQSPFEFYEIKPDFRLSFSSSIVSPETVLAISRQVFNTKVKICMLAIRGYSWEQGAGLSPGAVKNLARACTFFSEKILPYDSPLHTLSVTQ